MNIFEAVIFEAQFVTPFFLTISAMILLRSFALKIGLIDKPCSRKQHLGEVPLTGGLAIYLCTTAIILFQTNGQTTDAAFLCATTIIAVTGLIDDYKNLDFKLRFAAEVAAALIAVDWGGIQISSLGNLFGYGEIQLGSFATLFTVFAFVGGINAFNMIDGIDGLAGGTSLIIFVLLLILSVTLNYPAALHYCCILAPATAGFLIFNFPMPGRKKAWAFLGDTGSMLFGFTISWLVISASQGEDKVFTPITSLWLIAIPVLDTLCVMIRRIRKGRSPFSPDREHFHHILPVAGYSKTATLFIILFCSTVLAAIGVIGDLVLNVPEWLMFYLFTGLFALYYWGMSHSWKMVKVARYLREHNKARRKTKNRRSTIIHQLPFADRRVLPDRRSGIERRYRATERDLISLKIITLPRQPQVAILKSRQ